MIINECRTKKRENKVNEMKMEQKRKPEKYRQQLKLSLDEDPGRTFDLSHRRE